MILKRCLTAALLLFVGVSLVVALDLVRPAGEPGPHGPATAARLIVYSFHGATTCPTCRAIEELTRETLATRFADELAAGEIEWRVVDFDAPGNGHYVEDFGLYAAMIVLADGRATPPARWMRLDGVWEHADDRTAFVAYVGNEVSAFLEGERR
jgi:hypothetical protein